MPFAKANKLSRLARLPKRAKTTFEVLRTPGALVLDWAIGGSVETNWGDKLNPYMARKLVESRLVHRSEILPHFGMPVHYWIGSHLGKACADSRSVVWGAGFIDSNTPITGTPHTICAVRGWKSDARLREAGIATPGTVGDAALLLPQFYTPRYDLPRVQLGIIPHYTEWDEPFFQDARNWDDVRIIDITGAIEDVVEQIVSCDRIASSSLHGIICSDAYGVPAIWLRVSGKPVGDGFKFLDYLSSVGRKEEGPLPVDANTPRTLIEDTFQDYTIDIDIDALWAACPASTRI